MTGKFSLVLVSANFTGKQRNGGEAVATPPRDGVKGRYLAWLRAEIPGRRPTECLDASAPMRGKTPLHITNLPLAREGAVRFW